MDEFYRQACQVPELEFALTVLTTVVSRPTPERAIVDAGRKTLNIEIHRPRVADRDDVHVGTLSAEHGALLLDESARGLRIGDRLELIPGYVDFTAVLHDEFFAFRDGRLEAILPIEGRGKLR
jgi:D-serine deaminase-like pyridoxal phosphate-dependent protein